MKKAILGMVLLFLGMLVLPLVGSWGLVGMIVLSIAAAALLISGAALLLISYSKSIEEDDK